MSTLRVAVLGLGIGRRHVEAYRSLPDVAVTAIADVDENALAKAQEGSGVPFVHTDYRRAVDREDVDLVSICTPDRLHAEQALFALEAGKHVYCEKPLATCLDDAARIVHKVRETGRTFMTGLNYRFIPQFARIKEMVEAGTLGDVFYGDSSYIQDLYFMEQLGPDYWRLKDPQDFYLGGAVHNVDLLRWIMGEVEEVHSYANRGMPFYPLDDNYVSNLRFAGGRIGRLLLILGARLKEKFVVELNVYGREGALRAIMQRDEVIRNIDRLPGETPEVVPVPAANSHALAIGHFVDCIREGKQPLVDATEGAKAVAVCEAAIRSAREGKPVCVDYAAL